METLDDLLLETEEDMTKAIDFLGQQFAGVRTGKASPNLVENISISYYGSNVRMKEIANISTPEPRLIVINAFDPTALPAIEKAIVAANIGVTPMNDGRVIRIPFPELSEDRRKELTKVARQMAEKGRVSVRNVRQTANEKVKSMCKSSTITEDDRDVALEEIQKLTDDHTKQIDEALKNKEEEIMSI